MRGVVPDQPEGTGTIYLVTDLGTKFGVPSIAGASSLQLATALGLGNFKPAPESILRLLPNGAALDPNAVRTFDSVPVQEGAGALLPQPEPGGQPSPAPYAGDGSGEGGTTQEDGGG